MNELRVTTLALWQNLETDIIEWNQDGLMSAWDQNDSWHFDTKVFCLATDEAQRGESCAPLIHINFGKSSAFGSGKHATTRAALTALSKKLFPLPHSVLDVGCGNGILAISASLAGVTDVVATDIDQAIISEAIDFSQQHQASVEFIVTDEPPARKFDLIIANIPAAVLKDLAKNFVDGLNPNGCLILAGFMEPDGKELDKIFLSFGLSRIDLTRVDGWVAQTYSFV